MGSRPTRTSTRLRVVAVALMGLVLAAIVMTQQAVAASTDRRDSVAELMDLRAQSFALSQLEWRRQATGSVSADLTRESVVRRSAFDRLVGGMARRHGDQPTTRRVAGAATAFASAYDRNLTGAGATEADRRRTATSFESLQLSLDHAVSQSERSARRWLLVVQVLVAAIVPLMALTALWWLRRETRREASVEAARTELASERRFEAMVRGASDLVLVTGPDDGVTYASPAARRVLGCAPAALLGSGLDQRLHVSDVVPLREALDDVRSTPTAETSVELRAVHDDGSWRTLECRLRNAAEEDVISGVVWNLRDVTERRALEGQLSHQAFHDGLTGLANRALLTDRLGQALPRAERSGAGVGVVVIDLDGFKDINDSLGHEAGDEVIVAAAARLQHAVRLGDTVARFGGDEFVLLLEELATEGVGHAIAERAVELLSQPMHAGGRQVMLTASAGLSWAAGPDLAATDLVEALVRDADVAMYAAKQRGKSRAVVFESAMRAVVQDRLDLVVDVRSAAAKGEIRPLYQPLVDLHAQRVVGFEALARWHHPTRGVILPESFVPLAEESGAIAEIGSYMLRAACTQVAWWNGTTEDADPLEISVNLSARQLGSSGLVAEVREVLADTGLAPALLVLEVTESAVVEDVAAATRRLRELRALGVRIAMDDFGTGYSSLSYLRSLPIDILKIDKSFLGDHAGRGSELLAGVASLGATLGLTTVAEGIEQPSQLAAVRAAGCTMGQGFHFAQPLPPEAARAFGRDQHDRFAEAQGVPVALRD